MRRTLERLRAQASEQEKRYTIEDAKGVVAGVVSGLPIDVVARQAALTTEEVFSLVGKLGTWLTHVHGAAAVEIQSERGTQGRLFALERPSTKVLVPIGFERFGPEKRSVARAYAAIALYAPDDATLLRFIDRLYPPETDVLDAQMVFTVWGFFRLGRIEDIPDVTTSPAFNRAAADAIQLLQNAIERAEEAFMVFSDLDASPEALGQACQLAPWTAEGKIRRLGRLVELSPRAGVRSLRAMQREIIAEGAVPGTWRFEGPHQLTEGHVLRICEAAGFHVESRRRDENEIRRKLVDAGLKADIDRLLPEGLRARDAGVEDEFWEAIRRRVEGDPDWRTELSAALEA